MDTIFRTPRWINQRSTIMAEVATIAAAGVRGAVEWFRRRRNARTLGRLSDRQLDDLGLHRSQIPSLAHDGGVGRARYRHAGD